MIIHSPGPSRSLRLSRDRRLHLFAALVSLGAGIACAAQGKPAPKPAPNPAPDVLVLANGDTLHGKFVNEIAGKITFHSEPLGDVSLTWDKIKELHTSQKFAVMDSAVINGKTKRRGKKAAMALPVGTLDVASQAVTVHPENAGPGAPIAVKNAQYILDAAALDKQVNHEPGFFQGWNGTANAGATLVTATQDQYTVTGGISLVRTVPTVSWLTRRNRTTTDFTGSFGKITQPGYTVPATPTTPATPVAAVVTKTAIYHADAERDEYFSPRFFALAQTAFDHNYGQDLGLQQIYGGGFGWTVVKTPKQETDLKGTIQYEKQQFIAGATGTNQDLIGSTFAATYVLHMKLFNYTQGVSFIPSYNVMRAYSATENDTFAFPAYKRLSFTLGTMDSYLNDPPASEPPTKRNSFQFTMGFSYAIKSSY